MEDLKKGTIIETVASTFDRDSQGEQLDIEGADISPLQQGLGFANSDHMPGFDKLVGHVLDAKKIMKAEDAETSFQMKEWSRLRKPFIAAKIELWDNTGHKEADAIGAIYKHYNAKGQPSPIKVSVEGKILERGRGNESHVLKQTLIKGIAITVQPANKQTSTEVVGIAKSVGMNADSLMKTETPPAFIEVSDSKSDTLSHLTKLHRLLITANKMMQGVVKDKK